MFLTHTWVSCGTCAQQSLDEVVCSCADIIKEFGAVQCTTCGLDYEFLPEILEYAAGIDDCDLRSGGYFAVYTNYVRHMPTPCACCKPTYADYIERLIEAAGDWATYYSQFDTDVDNAT